MSVAERLGQYIDGDWRVVQAGEYREVVNPATARTLAQAAAGAACEWRRTSAGDRVQVLFQFKQLLETHLDDIARTITDERGKTYNERAGKRRYSRPAAGLQQPGPPARHRRTPLPPAPRRRRGDHSLQLPRHDRPLWLRPYALATGNCFILKPRDGIPLTSRKLFPPIDRPGLPPGLRKVVTGGKETVDALDVPRDQLRRLHADCAVRLRSRGGDREARPVPERREELDRDQARRRPGYHDEDRGRFRVRGRRQRCLATAIAVTVGAVRQGFTERIARGAAAGGGAGGRARQAGRRLRGRLVRLPDHPRPRPARRRDRPDGDLRPDAEPDPHQAPTRSTWRSRRSMPALTATGPASSPAAGRSRGSSAMRRKSATSASTSALPRRWPSSRLAARATVSSVTSTLDADTTWSFTPRRRC